MNQSPFDPIDDVIKAFSNGEIVVMTDDENRENEGDLICAAEKVNAESINFMITHARGLHVYQWKKSVYESCLLRMTLLMHQISIIGFWIRLMFVRASTGISAADRAATVRALVDEKWSSRFY